jgi:predicted O-methyltransferase YrrM
MEALMNDSRSDKQTVHSYLPLYEDLLSKKRETATDVLEVGICYGGSIKLWYDYFSNANVYALDIINYNKIWDELKGKDRIKLFSSFDAYNEEIVNKCFGDKKFDFILDDGPHTLESQLKFLDIYLPLLKEDGILIIEDIESEEYLNILVKNVPQEYQDCIKTFDLTDIKGRYDDRVLCVDLS